MSDRTGTAWFVCSGEDALFTELYRRHYRPIRDFCRRRVAGDLVDDAVAETFLTAWRRFEDVPAGDEALLWLYGVAYRVIGHQWRSHGPSTTARGPVAVGRESSRVRRGRVGDR